MSTICNECQSFRSQDMRGKKQPSSDGFYDSWYERPEAYGKSAITFTEESGLGSDTYAIVQKYLKGDMNWYHLMIARENFINFLEVFDKMKHRIFVLPFWCLCNGRNIIHRHMIMAVDPEIPFKHVWVNEVNGELKDGKRGKKCIPIKKVFELIRTIQYVSQPNA